MTMQNPDRLVTKSDLHDYHESILPYLNGGGSGGGGHTIEDSTGTALTQRDVMQFSDSFAPTDDSTNEVTKIELNKLTSGEMDDIVTPLPSVQSRYHEYSTDEHIVGKWIDGSYIYEKTLLYTNLNRGDNTVNLNTPNLNKVLSFTGIAIDRNNNNSFITLPQISSSSNYSVTVYGFDTSRCTIFIGNGFTYTDYNFYVTIQYTKTTS